MSTFFACEEHNDTERDSVTPKSSVKLKWPNQIYESPPAETLPTPRRVEDQEDVAVESDHNDTVDTGDGIDKRASMEFIPTEDEAELSSLFLTALHSFDATTLEMESDMAICLSLQKSDVALVHCLDASGCAEVTLLRTLERGWIPGDFSGELSVPHV